MSAARAAGPGWRGCLEIAGLVVFALALGAFAASTWLRHTAGGGDPSAPSGREGDPAAYVVDRSRIRVEVKNGSGIEGAAGRMTEYLRAQGFDVVEFGNAERFDHPRTFVVGGGEQARLAREVAAALRGVPLEAADSLDPSIDVTVVVGRDLEEVLERDEPVARGGWRGWLDRLRGR